MNKNFLCSKCFKTFDRKSNFIRHINRLKPCSIDKRTNYSKENNKQQLKKYINKNFPKINDNIISEIIGDDFKNVEKKFTCDFCCKSFQSSTYFKKHLRELCSRHMRFEQHIIREYLKRIEKLKEDNLELKEKIYYTQKTLPRYCIEEGKVVNVEKNYVHFYEQKNIKPFGDEIVDHVTDKFMKKMIMNPEIGIVNLIRMIHFNREIPQNRNVFVKSIKFGSIEIYKKGGWKTIPKKDAFQCIIATKKDIMDEYFDRFVENNELKLKYTSKYDIFSNYLDQFINHIVFNTEYDNKLKKAKIVYEKICKMLNLLFLNNQKIEITYTPEQNIKTSTDELKNVIKPKKKNNGDEEEDDGDEGYELYCEENINTFDRPVNVVNKLIDETEKKVMKFIRDNNLQNIKDEQSFQFLNDMSPNIEDISEDHNDNCMNINFTDDYIDQEIIIRKK